MAIPKPDPRDWQIANAQELQITDREVLQLLQDTKKNVDRILKELESQGKAGIRRAQLERTRALILAQQATLFERLGDTVAARRAAAASRSARLSAADDASLLRLVGREAEAQYLYDSMLQVSQRAIDAALARMRLSALPLSQRIYNTSVWMGGRLGRLINETLATGLNAREFAKRARDWFSPNTPGGVRYAAMRLARTEINNSFHAISAEKYATTPWATQVIWNLSKSHPRPDICNAVAAQSPYEKASVPARPHPQCMCYITAEYEDEDDFVENFLKGDYDDYLDAELEKNGWQEPDHRKPDIAPKADFKPQVESPIGTNSEFISLKDAGLLNVGSEFLYHGSSKADFKLKGRRVRVADPRVKGGINARSLVDAETGEFVEQQANAAAKWWIERLPDTGKTPLSGQAVLDSVPKGLYKRGSMTAHQRAALKTYETGWFTVINGFLRDGRWGQPDYREEERDIGRIDSAMEESILPSDVQVWRGLYSADMIFGDRFDKDLTGFAWEEKAYSSTTANESIVKSFNAEMRLDDRVRIAYKQLAAEPGNLVSLVRLRDKLQDVPRDELDRILIQMNRERVIQLDPDPNRKALTDQARLDAIPVGGEDMNLITIDQSNLTLQQKNQNVKLTVTVPAGTKALVTSEFDKGSKENGPQAELTLQRGMKWSVVKDNGVNADGVRELEVRADPIQPKPERPTADAIETGRDVPTSSPERAEESVSTNPEQQFVESLVTFHGDGRDEVVEQMMKESELTPRSIKFLTGVSKMTSAEAKALKARFGKDAIGGYTTESRSIAIAPEVFTESYDKAFAKEVNSGFLSKCPHGHKHDGLKSFVAHEYGHHVEVVIRFGGASAMRPVVRAAAAALGIAPPSLYDHTSIDRWVAKNKAVISKQVSKYGSETGGELWAEVWAEYSANPNPRPHIKAIGDAIRAAAESNR